MSGSNKLLRRWTFVTRASLLLGLLVALMADVAGAATVIVGSKRFTESYVLGEIVRQTLQAGGAAAEHRQGLGNTAILEQALASGAIDVYPEYTGTIVRELLKRDAPGDANPPLARLNEWLAPRGLKALAPLGFNNTYALAMREADAARLGIDSISALARLAQPEAARLRLGLSHEFLVRADGWPALKQAYALPMAAERGIDHGLAYEALAQGQVDLIDVYSTDAKVGRLKLRVLRDDKAFFPRYDAVLLMRVAAERKLPDLAARLATLEGRINEATMTALNAEVELDGRSFADVARGFVEQRKPAGAGRAGFVERLLAPDLPRLLGQHLVLVFVSLVLAAALAVPLGVLAHRRPVVGAFVMGAVGVVQTVPSLALLAFLIALLGVIGFWPALIALMAYALLPIVRNTHAGLQSVDAGLVQAATALGLRRGQVLRSIELPLAAPTLLAGLKTAAVINVGTATVAAFIGAGGLGERIVAGLAVNDNAQMLAGAVPAALLALLVQLLFEGGERLLRHPSAAGSR